nr:MAG TPA: hypothetical protein [Caudoviricetes sp.]
MVHSKKQETQAHRAERRYKMKVQTTKKAVKNNYSKIIRIGY